MLLLCHFIGDYYLQTNKMAQSKENSIQNTLIHSGLYAVPFVLLLVGLAFLGFLNVITIGIVVLTVLSHAVIDLIKCVFEMTVGRNESESNDGKYEFADGGSKLSNRKFNSNGEFKRIIYLADQTLHLIIVVIAAVILSELAGSVNLSPEIYMFFKYALFAVIIVKPVNICFKKIFEKYQPVQKTNENGDEIESIAGAGATIGNLERFLMGIFIGIGQYAALGLVMTAKSIARYDQISKNKMFAEYFLIGTLYSVLATLIVYFIIFVVFA
ncbi:DUF3307 domain-containing protein [Methanimicrococcus blatticola]|nr:DUF3307 domain-containing protein [Methanimicrococcus blatticola]MCC2509007.1 DUF3307 domain-containing protein [Methanimicrococcus blatticola]